MIAFALGGLVGLSLGLVGGGGSILTVPLLVGVLGLPAREATTMSLVIVGSSAAWASLAHARRGNVLWRRALLFGAVGIAGTTVGGVLNRDVPPTQLLAAFVVLMVVAAVATWRRAQIQERAVGVATSGLRLAPAASVPSQSLRARMRSMLPPACPIVDMGPFIATAIGVGLLTGFFGVGGGFLIVPALVVVLRLPMSKAIGTSLPIIAINSGTALLGHLGTGASIDPTITALFTLGAIAGGLVGGTFSTRLPAATLGRGFALVVLTLAVYLFIQVL